MVHVTVSWTQRNAGPQGFALPNHPPTSPDSMDHSAIFSTADLQRFRCRHQMPKTAEWEMFPCLETFLDPFNANINFKTSIDGTDTTKARGSEASLRYCLRTTRVRKSCVVCWVSHKHTEGLKETRQTPGAQENEKRNGTSAKPQWADDHVTDLLYHSVLLGKSTNNYLLFSVHYTHTS